MTEDAPRFLTCPKCGQPMEHVHAGECAVDRCTGCAGIWLDANERLKLMKDESQVKAIDTGSPEAGRRHDEVTRIDCPYCGAPMRHMKDRAQRHVGFEHCVKCRGSFFDAGELTDLSDFTLVERIKAFFSP